MRITDVELKDMKKTNSRILKFFGGICIIYIIIGIFGKIS